MNSLFLTKLGFLALGVIAGFVFGSLWSSMYSSKASKSSLGRSPPPELIDLSTASNVLLDASKLLLKDNFYDVDWPEGLESIDEWTTFREQVSTDHPGCRFLVIKHSSNPIDDPFGARGVGHLILVYKTHGDGDDNISGYGFFWDQGFVEPPVYKFVQVPLEWIESKYQ